MTIHSPGPAFVQIHYHSGWGRHIQTIPIGQWFPPDVLNPLGTVQPWAVVFPTSLAGMVDDLVNKFAAIAQSAVVWDQVVVFTQPDPAVPAHPRAIGALTQVGALAVNANDIAMQQTYTFFDSDFNTVKLVLLDMEDSLGNFPVPYASLNAAHKAIVDTFTDDNAAWSSRAGFRPNTLRQAVQKRNDKLRREYGLV